MISVQNAAGLVASLSNSEVFVMNHDGSSMRNLTNNPAFDAWPRWSPHGKQIVFGSNRENKTDYEI
jgi:Tol biopolymer transport system component